MAAAPWRAALPARCAWPARSAPCRCRRRGQLPVCCQCLVKTQPRSQRPVMRSFFISSPALDSTCCCTSPSCPALHSCFIINTRVNTVICRVRRRAGGVPRRQPDASGRQQGRRAKRRRGRKARPSPSIDLQPFLLAIQLVLLGQLHGVPARLHSRLAVASEGRSPSRGPPAAWNRPQASRAGPAGPQVAQGAGDPSWSPQAAPCARPRPLQARSSACNAARHGCRGR